MTIRKGLIIEAAPISKILGGDKTWEMRSAPTRLRGTIALIEKRSGQVVGLADLVNSLGPLSDDELRNSYSKHQISSERLRDPRMAKYRFAWELANARRLREPVHYSHPSGAVIWVNLAPDVSSQLD